MLRMDEINKIRKAYLVDGESKYAIALRFRRSWETINNIVSAEREDLINRGKRPNRKPRLVTSEVLQEIKALLDEEIQKKVRRKQRYTATKIYKILKEKKIYKGSERRMQDIVRIIREERSQLKKESFLPLSFSLGSTLQIDHGEADLEIRGERYTGYLFIASVPGEVLRYCQIFPIKSQEAWGEFHERAFSFFKGAFPKIVYDNDSVLVKKVIGSERSQTDFSHSLEEHFGFESHFCNLASGNEKGAVENGVGYCRRNFLAGTPSFDSWDEVNSHLEASCMKNIQEGHHYKTKKPLLEAFEQLKDKLKPLLPKMNWNKSDNYRVDSCQLISIKQNSYSVPEKYIGGNVRVEKSVFLVKIFNDEEIIALHERQYGSNDSLNLNHYLDQLQYKANAFWDCKAVTNKKFDENLMEIWGRLSERLTKKEANQQFVKILILGRKYSEKALLKAVKTAIKYGAIDHAAVENILKQQEIQKMNFDEAGLKNKLESVEVLTWEFDLSPYKELCEEAL